MSNPSGTIVTGEFRPTPSIRMAQMGIQVNQGTPEVSIPEITDIEPALKACAVLIHLGEQHFGENLHPETIIQATLIMTFGLQSLLNNPDSDEVTPALELEEKIIGWVRAVAHALDEREQIKALMDSGSPIPDDLIHEDEDVEVLSVDQAA